MSSFLKKPLMLDIFHFVLPGHSLLFSTPIAWVKIDITGKYVHGKDMHKENGTIEKHICHMARNISITFTLSSVYSRIYNQWVIYSQNYTIYLPIHQLTLCF